MAPVRKLSLSPHSFETISIDQLKSLARADLDQLPFGVVGISVATGNVELYNATESRMAGLVPEQVLHTDFFNEIGRCMNNKRVAGRFDAEPELDEIVDYVLTLRMKLTPARLRLLRRPASQLKYLLIQR